MTSKSSHRPQERWDLERSYWFEALKGLYEAYGRKPHPLQSDPAVVPPAALVSSIQSASKSKPDVFLATGYRGVHDYLCELRDHGFEVDRMTRVLEMGVGLGRLLLHYLPFRGTELHGCDRIADAIEWTKSVLGDHAEVRLTQAEPPLPYPDGHFDYIYANSVFTHIPHGMQEPWVAELWRVSRPGACVISSHFEANTYLRHLAPRECHRLFGDHGWFEAKKELGVHMRFYARQDYLRWLWGARFDVLEIRPHFLDQSHLVARKA